MPNGLAPRSAHPVEAWRGTRSDLPLAETSTRWTNRRRDRPPPKSIDDRTQLSFIDQQIPGANVSVDPDGSASPRGVQRCFPDHRSRLGIDLPLKGPNGSPGIMVINRGRCAAIEVVLAGGGPSAASIRCRAVRNSASVVANRVRSAIPSMVAFAPSSHR